MSAIETRALIPLAEYKHLHGIAVKNQTTVGALVSEIVRRSLQLGVAAPEKRRYKHVTPALLEELVRMHAARHGDHQIAAATGMSPTNVQRHRKRLGLAANTGKGSRS